MAVAIITAATFLAACNKEGASIASSADPSTKSDIAVAADDSSVGKDSVYFKHDCGDGTRDSIAPSELPSAATTYLEDNYSGYTFAKAFSVSDTAGTITGYVAVIHFEDQPIGIEFSSGGEFVRVLEQRGFRRHHRGRHD